MQKIKAITVNQPYASLLAVGVKKYETRGWYTNYRGLIAIHAGLKSYKTWAFTSKPLEPFVNALKHYVDGFNKGLTAPILPYGAVIAIAKLVGCWEIESVKKYEYAAMLKGNIIEHIKDDELLFGNWSPNRYAWEMANVNMLSEPIPIKGKQGLWNWEMPDGIAI